jgi:hypothetical protein
VLNEVQFTIHNSKTVDSDFIYEQKKGNKEDREREREIAIESKVSRIEEKEEMPYSQI